MAIFSEFLLVSDFDHTLTDHTGQIPQANLDAISYFTSHGGKFTVSTGRSLPAAQIILQQVPINAPLLFCNGAGCYDTVKNEPVFCYPLPDDADLLINFCLETFPDLLLEVHTLDAHHSFGYEPYRDAILRKRGIAFYYPENTQAIPKPWVKFSLYSRNGDAATLDLASERGQYFTNAANIITEQGKGAYTATQSMPGLIEVQRVGTSKGLAARELAGMLGRSTLVCVGDAPNDIPMLEEADLAFLAADGDPRMTEYPYKKAAPSYEGTVADVIRILEEHS